MNHKTNITKTVLAAVLALTCLFCLFSCKGAEDPWSQATYTEDQSFGSGSKTVLVKVQVEEHSVTFTLKTDRETLGAALLEQNLIAGEEGEFGLYVKTVNGILADYDVDGYYWSLTKKGEMMMTGVDTTPISDGEEYELVRTH